LDLFFSQLSCGSLLEDPGRVELSRSGLSKETNKEKESGEPGDRKRENRKGKLDSM
jgi:hypothetical protein